MPLDSKQLAMDIAANVRTVAAAPGSRCGTMTAWLAPLLPPLAGFCSIWPKAKPVLELVAGVVTSFPERHHRRRRIAGSHKGRDQISADVCK